VPIPPNFGDVLTQTASLFVFGCYLDVEQRLAMFCAPEARLLVCRSPAFLGMFPTGGLPAFLSTA